jgi:hypothetical protein
MQIIPSDVSFASNCAWFYGSDVQVAIIKTPFATNNAQVITNNTSFAINNTQVGINDVPKMTA